MNYYRVRARMGKKKRKATKLEESFLLEPNFHFKNSTFNEVYICHLNRQITYIMIEMKAVILNIN